MLGYFYGCVRGLGRRGGERMIRMRRGDGLTKNFFLIKKKVSYTVSYSPTLATRTRTHFRESVRRPVDHRGSRLCLCTIMLCAARLNVIHRKRFPLFTPLLAPRR